MPEFLAALACLTVDERSRLARWVPETKSKRLERHPAMFLLLEGPLKPLKRVLRCFLRPQNLVEPLKRVLRCFCSLKAR